ncbi:MAG: hypothetical protein WD897_00885 [Parcubacteria group bacterium]
MRTIIIILTVLAVVIFFFITRSPSPVDKIETPAFGENGVFRPDPSNATFIFDDGPITLSAGRNERKPTSGSALAEETVLLDKFAYGDINADVKEDTVLFLARYGSGSGTFIYLAAFISGPITYRGSKAVFIGDRIAPQSISINGEIVTAKYLDRGSDDAFAVEPTVPTTKQFIYRDGEFQEK